MTAISERFRVVQDQPQKDVAPRDNFVIELEQQVRRLMSTIIGLSEMEMSKTLSAEQSSVLQKINSAGNSLMDIFSNVIRFSKVEDGKLKVNEEIFDVEAVVADACTTNREKFTAQATELLVQFDLRTSAKLLGDGTHLWQIIKKLLEKIAPLITAGLVRVIVNRHRREAQNETLEFEIRFNVPAENLSATLNDLQYTPENKLAMNEVYKLVSKTAEQLTFTEFDAQTIVAKFPLTYAILGEEIPCIGNFFAEKFSSLFGKRLVIFSENLPLAENLGILLGVVHLDYKIVSDLTGALNYLLTAKEKNTLPEMIITDLAMNQGQPDEIAVFLQENAFPKIPHLIFAPPTSFEQYAQKMQDAKQSLENLGIVGVLEKPASLHHVLNKLTAFLQKNAGKELINTSKQIKITSEMKIDWTSLSTFIQGFAREEALVRLGNSQELYGKMLNDFYFTIEKEVEHLAKIVETLDQEKLRVAAHTIKSMAAYVGAEKLREVALNTEMACKNNESGIALLLRNFIGECRGALTVIQSAYYASICEPDNEKVLRSLYTAVEFCAPLAARKLCAELIPGERTWTQKLLTMMAEYAQEYKFGELLELLKMNGIEYGATAKTNEKPTMLIIDDSASAITILQSLFADEAQFCATTDPFFAFKWLEKYQADLILLDVVMPQINGIAAYKKIREIPHAQNTPIIFISGVAEADIEKEALDLGAADYILKPYNVATVQAKVHNQLTAKKKHDDLSKTVVQQREQITQTQEAVIHGMAHLAEFRESYTGRHLKRIQRYTEIIAKKMAEQNPGLLTDVDIYYYVALSPVHDIGKVGITDAILKKNGKLTDEEFKEMQNHTVYGEDVIKKTQADLEISNAVMEVACQIAGCHHERWDGGGYPHKLKGEDIPLSARIVALADIYDALVSQRSYKPPFTHEQTMEIILKGDGRTMPTHFDPRILTAFAAAEADFKRAAESA